MRYQMFLLYVVVTVLLVLMAISDFLFGDGSIRKLGRRLLLTLVWPLAVFSGPGRHLLLSVGKEL